MSDVTAIAAVRSRVFFIIIIFSVSFFYSSELEVYFREVKEVREVIEVKAKCFTGKYPKKLLSLTPLTSYLTYFTATVPLTVVPSASTAFTAYTPYCNALASMALVSKFMAIWRPSTVKMAM